MSHDFPDGPDYNPEPLDDDPWDVPEAHPDPPECLCAYELLDWSGQPVKRWYHEPDCPNSPPEATDADFRPTDA